ncbi:hypothetical protein MCOR02_005915 [Pyricularia oryzae]|nr:hypothetical protein MCOR02_005915 [Pyricularia oryzae]KAI6345098.1 hypothetical protein MCOR28_003722 [Pyricularia oryzae]KAI6435578.1 hypothetical protein MCOR24_000721 [Pyricularia oryzae]KAI6511857.1 hypothetical protein MCOR13_000419 [Pyricularia oryzae]KAI6522931.1 hypothetical protein MCOR10_005455 [Pyricularia oryzae]
MNGRSDHQAQPQSSNYSRSDLDGPSSVVPYVCIFGSFVRTVSSRRRRGLARPKRSPAGVFQLGGACSILGRYDSLPCSQVAEVRYWACFFPLIVYDWHHVVKKFSSRLLSSMRTAPSRAMCRSWSWRGRMSGYFFAVSKERPALRLPNLDAS